MELEGHRHEALLMRADPATFSDSTSIGAALRWAADLCLVIGAFVVNGTGEVHHALAEPEASAELPRRIEALARTCLEHPAARGRSLFWNAEVFTEAGSPDDSLACAVIPIWAGSRQVGLLGIVDTWLPEPDEDQRAGLVTLAVELATALVPGPGSKSGPPADRVPGRVHIAESRNGVGSGERGEPPEPPAEAVTPESRPAPPPTAGIDVDDLIEALDDAVMVLDATGKVVLANHATDALYGLPTGRSLVGSPFPSFPTARGEHGESLPPDSHPALLVLRDGVAHNAQLMVGEREGQRRLTVSARPLDVLGATGVVVTVRDTTAEWVEQQRLSRYAMYDPLTGLANRYLLSEELRRMIRGLGRRGGSVALVYLDLDRFKRINDEYGHDMGDEVLGAVARRLRGAVRSDDVVARLGGDEFVIAHASSESTPDGERVVSRLRKVLSAPFRVREHAFDVGASIGWVSTDRSDSSPEAILTEADRAMYEYKRDRDAARQLR